MVIMFILTMDGHHVHPSNLMVSYGFDPSQIKLKMKQCSAAVLGDHQLKKISLMLSTNLIYQMPKNLLNIIVFTSARQFSRVFDQQQVVFHGGKAGNSILILVNITELNSYDCQHQLSSSIINWLRWNMMNHYYDWWTPKPPKTYPPVVPVPVTRSLVKRSRTST